MPGRFQDKVAIVTGSSNGIGRATALLFAQEGAHITVTGRNEQSLKETVDLIVSHTSLKAEDIVQVKGDLTCPELQKKIIDETAAKFGKIDILVNNAGGVAPDKTPDQGFDMDFSVFDYTINLNVKAAINLTRLAVPHLEKTKGEVIMISSIAALPFATFSYPYYNISKAALDQATRSMAAQYIAKGIRVNSVNPGAVATTIGQKQGATPEMMKQFQPMLEDPKMIPIRRIGQPEDIANFIAFLADRRQSEFIVGQCMVIDGGTSLLNPMFLGFGDKMKDALEKK